ncbi:MAG TPA: tRNA isopentenyl-2-thiomethyl-A-37 hydroxylase MiaE [Polyangia bacterium]
MILNSATHPRWFAAATADLHALLSDHLHCERKAAENALSLVRRYPHRGGSVDVLGRLAHEETSHVVQVAGLLAARGWAPRADTPNLYARGLFAEVRDREPLRLLDTLLVAAFIEARSHERLDLLARGFAACTDEDEQELGAFYRALANAEERHAEIFLELGASLVPPDDFEARIAEMAVREAQILAALPHASRVH